MWANIECPDNHPSQQDLDACGPFKFLMDDEDHDVFARIQAGIEAHNYAHGTKLPQKPSIRITKKVPACVANSSSSASSVSGMKVNRPPAKTAAEIAASSFED